MPGVLTNAIAAVIPCPPARAEDIQPTAPLAFAGARVLLFVVAQCDGYAPARLAGRIDPLITTQRRAQVRADDGPLKQHRADDALWYAHAAAGSRPEA